MFTCGSNFQQVCKLVFRRVQEIPKEAIVRYWHYTVLRLYEYLYFKRI